MRPIRTRGGNFVTFFALGLTTLLGAGAIAVDLSYVRTVRAQLKNGVDAAAHAALVELRATGNTDSATTVAQAVAAANRAGGYPVAVENTDVVFGAWDFDSHSFDPSAAYFNAVQVASSRDEGSTYGGIRLFIGPTLGWSEGDAAASAVAAFRFRDMVIVQDVTISFQDSIDRAREADVAFLDYVHEQNFPRDRIGMVTFTGDAETWTDMQIVADNYTTIRDQWFGDGVPAHYTYVDRRGRTVDAYNNKTAGLTECYDPGRGAPFGSNYMISCWAGGGYTSPGPGILRGVSELLALGDNGNVKIIIFVSDGRPQCATASSSDPCTAARIQAAYDAADYAADNGIHTFVVSFCEGCSESEQATQFAFNARLVTGIGQAYNTPSADELPDILLAIAQAIPLAIVSAD